MQIILKQSKLLYSFAQSYPIPSYFTFDPYQTKTVYKAQNFVSGKWTDAKDYESIPDPITGDKMFEVPNTKHPDDVQPFIDNAKNCPISGLHNPLKNPERYFLYGEVNHRIAAEMAKKEVQEYLVKLIQRTVPKHYNQALGEVLVTQRFFQNFGGDQPRFMSRSFNVAGDRNGQQSTGYRWPFGACALISPFNFPLEIPCLQLFGALMVGNRVFFKGDNRVNVVMEQFLRMALHLGLPPTDLDMMFGHGRAVENILIQGNFRTTQFTGSSQVAEHLVQVLKGKVRIEDAGFDWKILGPDVPQDKDSVDYVAWQCDQDAYASTGQKCSAQSILFAHENWMNVGLVDKIKQLASTRNLNNLSVAPILSLNNAQIKAHIDAVLTIPGAKLLFGGKELQNHKIPSVYGSYEPTAIFVPLEQILNPKYNKLVATEIFGPFQIVTQYSSSQIDQVLSIINGFSHHLTAGIVSNDINFLRYVQANTVNGVTYCGIRARTTGAPQNHWFGPCGDPRGAGIGTPEAINLVWTCHREIVEDSNNQLQGLKLTQS